jgi:hypothetical protein
MPLRPDFTQHRPDPRLDRYRDRVGRLFRGGNEVGLVLVQAQAEAEQVGGRLWWRRWGPTRDALWLWTIVDGEFSDHWVADGLDEELASYGQGRFLLAGEELSVRWADVEESASLRRSAFG